MASWLDGLTHWLLMTGLYFAGVVVVIVVACLVAKAIAMRWEHAAKEDEAWNPAGNDWNAALDAEETRLNAARKKAGYRPPPPDEEPAVEEPAREEPPPAAKQPPKVSPEVEKARATLRKVESLMNDRSAKPGERENARRLRARILRKIATLEEAA